MSDPRLSSPPDGQAANTSWNESVWARYALAVASVLAATLLMFVLHGAFGLARGSVPFVFYFGAVILSARYGGRWPGRLTILLSAIVADFFFFPPFNSFSLEARTLLQVAVFIIVSLFVSSLIERSRRAERAASEARTSLETTLRSIGDAVISTDDAGRVVFMNKVAERLTGWPLAEARSRTLAEVFRIFNEETRAEVESPVEKVLREGRVVGLANHTVLVARDGTETPIDDSGAPVKDEHGRTNGVVLVFHDITERRRAEAVRTMLAAIVESSDVAIIGKLLDGTITSWNDAAARMYGYTAEEAVGQKISLIVPPERLEELDEIMSRLRRGERVEHHETVRVRKDGARLNVALSISLIRNASGRVVGASTIARDITKQKQVDEERARLTGMVAYERGRLRELVANVPGVVWEAWGVPDESSQRVDFISDHVEKMLGYTVEEWLATPNFWLTIVHPADRERAASEAHAIYESRAGGVSQFRWVRKDGRAIFVESQSVVVLDESGAPAGMRGVTMDITKRKQAEERMAFLAAAGEALSSSLEYEATLERLARLAVSELADYCLIDLVGDDGEARRVATAHADPASDALVGELRRFPPDTSKPGGVSKVLRTGETLVVPRMNEEEFDAIARDDEHRRLLKRLGLKSFMTVPLVTRERTIGALTLALTSPARAYALKDVAFAEELARRAALAIENARLYSRAQEVNRAKDEFLATLSHELRTPLTPIIGWTHMIRSGRLDEAATAQGIEVIEKNAQALSRLINDLLDMTSILSNKMRIERAAVELASVVRAAVETVEPRAAARGISLEVVYAGEGASACVSGDRTRLVQVFWNLLDNAVKFSPQDGHVRVRVETKEGAARVLIEDDGAGITSEFLPHVFERFRQADMGTTRRHGGLGIGLALVKSFVEAHGGRVEVESDGENRGSRFTVMLPALQTAGGRLEGGIALVSPQSATRNPQSAIPAGRVLLIDDAPDTLEMLSVALQARGYRATTCGDADEALRVAETGRFDIIISDIGLPRVDGYELIERLRRLPHMRRTPALALTGYASAKDAEAALAAGFDAHVAKPVDPASLAEALERLLRDRSRADKR